MGCAVCSQMVHLKCAQITPEDLNFLKSQSKRWKCNKCIKKNSTPGSPLPRPKVASQGMAVGDAASRDVSGDGSPSSSLVEMSETLKSLVVSNQDITKSLTFLHEKFDDQSSLIRSLEEKLVLATVDIERLRERNERLEVENERLRLSVNQLEQDGLERSLDIHGVLEAQGETPEATVIRVGHHLGMKMGPEAIESSHRFGRPESGGRAISVKFVYKRDRDQYLNLKKVKSDLSLDNRRIFINESLTAYNRQIYALARRAKAASEGRFKYLWIRNGCIYGRAEDGRRPIRIKTEKDVEMIK